MLNHDRTRGDHAGGKALSLCGTVVLLVEPFGEMQPAQPILMPVYRFQEKIFPHESGGKAAQVVYSNVGGSVNGILAMKRETRNRSIKLDPDINFVFARGRRFTRRQMQRIAEIVDRYYHEGRTQISYRVCRALRWKQPNGRLKDVACREALRKFHQLGIVSLPPPRSAGAVWKPLDSSLQYTVKHPPITSLAFTKIELRKVETNGDTRLWNSLVSTYHYLGSSRIVGRQLKYMALVNEQPVACLGWGDCSWALSSRDNWIGWTKQQRAKQRKRIINNVRFLILPWVKLPNLASHLLAKCSRRVVNDWQEKYAVLPVLLETYVDPAHFSGTCYRAANWRKIGITAGYAKIGNFHHNSQTPKILFVYPLTADFQQILTGKF